MTAAIYVLALCFAEHKIWFSLLIQQLHSRGLTYAHQVIRSFFSNPESVNYIVEYWKLVSVIEDTSFWIRDF